jgi:hypothetical protein
MRRYLLASILTAIALSGCGAGTGAESSLLATAVTKTENAGGAEIAFAMRMEVPGLPGPIEMRGSGIQDAGNRRGQMTFDLSSFGSIPGMAALCGSGCDMQVVSDDLTMYMRSDLLAPVLGGKEWIKVDLKRVGSSIGLDLGGSGQFGQNPAEQLSMLRAVSGDLREEGREQVAGTPTTRYRATVDLRRYADVVPEAQREATRRGIDRLIEISGESEIPMGVWIDNQNRVRRMTFDQTMKQGDVEVRMAMTIEYVRFGVPVELDIPSDSEVEVLDATDLALRQMESAQP